MPRTTPTDPDPRPIGGVTSWKTAPTHTISIGGTPFAYPELIRRVILAGTGPAGGSGIEKINRIAGAAYTKAALTLRDPRHFLFFPRTPAGKRAATEYMARLKERTEDRDKRI